MGDVVVSKHVGRAPGCDDWHCGYNEPSSFSKCLRALRMLMTVVADAAIAIDDKTDVRAMPRLPLHQTPFSTLTIATAAKSKG